MPHLDEGQLTLLLDNELDDSERTSVEAHLEECAECRRLLEETRGFMAEADRLIGSVDLPPRSLPGPAAAPAVAPVGGRPLPWRSLAWAATVVLAAGLGWFASDTRFHRPESALTDGYAAKLPAGAPEARRADALSTPAESSRGEADAAVAPTATPPTTAVTGQRPAPSAQPSGNLATNQAAARDERETPQLLERTAPPPAPAAAGTMGAASTQPAAPASGFSATGDVARRPASKSVAGQTGFQEITLDQAVRALGGTIRLLDGLTPVRAETGPPAAFSNVVGGLQLIRIVYEDPPGRELWLSQQRVAVEGDPTRARSSAAEPVLDGDTLLGNDPDGRRTLRWRDRDGFLLALSGYLPGDSLKSLARRVR